jgi:8-oxo-dGTP pyrophosphatase MutT (NUDIX family)
MSDSPAGSWINRGDTEIYHCPWLQLVTSDVLLPDGTEIDHHVVRMPRPAAGTIIVAEDHVLLLYRHRFITDTWGWEIPAGAVDVGETIEQAAIRESLEETGWKPRHVASVCTFYPANGVLDQSFHIFISHDAEHHGEPTDTNEAAEVAWHPIAEVRSMLAAGQISDGLSFGGIAFAFAMGALGAQG